MPCAKPFKSACCLSCHQNHTHFSGRETEIQGGKSLPLAPKWDASCDHEFRLMELGPGHKALPSLSSDRCAGPESSLKNDCHLPTTKNSCSCQPALREDNRATEE